jgi:translation elongation factor P/translation initiation factor 5A
MGKNANANNIGVLNRIEAPQREINNADNIITDGIEIIIVVIWKKELIAVPIPVKNI